MVSTVKKPTVTERLIALISEMSEGQQKILLDVLESKLKPERRNYGRKAYFTFVDLASQDHAYREFVKNISEGGVYIQTSRSFSVGEEVVVMFSSRDSKEHLKVTGHIVRVDGKGIGVEFEIDSPLERLSIRSLLKKL